MVFRAVMIILLTIWVAESVLSQKSRPARTQKAPVIRETVTVKGNLPPSPAPINESDSGVWRSFAFSEHRLTLEFPARIGETIENEVADSEGIWTYSAATERATYRIMVRNIAALLDEQAASEVLDDSIAAAYSGRKGSVLKRIVAVSYQGKPGREFVVHEKGEVQIVRIFILDQKLFAMFVTVVPNSQWPKMEVWARKFLDSFKVDMLVKGEA